MELEAQGIREQLERLLANPLFKNSKRYPTLLRYVVEKTLDGQAGLLKERNLGVDVLGRDADYDTNADPVVRMTAAEIRKRIAQYYHEPGHEHEIRIDLPSGSYVPEFHAPPGVAAAPAAAVSAPLVSKAPVTRRRRYLAGAAVVLLAAVVAVPVTLRLRKPDRAIDQFWKPVTNSTSPVLMCVGQRRFLATQPEAPQYANPDLARVGPPAAGESPTLYKLYYMGSQNVALPDVVALSGIAGWLQSRGKACRVQGETATNFDDLRSGPVVLIGAFNNDWTIRLAGDLPYWFKRDGDKFSITDRRQPGTREWSVSYDTPYLKVTEDYALISRVWDATTERLVVLVGGLTGYGTMAAGEFLSQPEYLEPLAGRMTRGTRTNLQVVIATKVIDGHSGPPRIVDSYFW